ncbi:drug/metabolite transporter (DMT)-like permease [Volucribacter psittacicida]|uniref:Drug/metabolite transporter (DMT)-like permease n=1 Tax=Volucribacter psittacicida TaxID=203482 RepID=A0A4R1FNX9_9PAST|nr:DMT family transporter [Volucribacter psittacicida]TCJ93968.1 drug/metabolite transporter (DMT)-like permease [Volucribacter psittacicida]
MLTNNLLLGIILALFAALLNSSIGIFSKILMQNGLNAQDIAFFKTLMAFLLLSSLCWRKPLAYQKQQIIQTPLHSRAWLWKVAICAFLGIFVLFFFETLAYGYGLASNVVVILMASATVSALIFEVLLLKGPLKITSVLGVLFAVMGIFVISWAGGSHSHLLMILNAIIAGTGYGLFSVCLRKFGLRGGWHLTTFLLFFGSLYLFFPYWWKGNDIQWQLEIMIYLAALAILPTILGFYCTTKALSYLTATKVQVIGLSEPIFAVLLAWWFLQEMPNHQFFIGASLIVLGILLINQIHLHFMRKYSGKA